MEIYFLENFWLQGRGPALRKLVACHKDLTRVCSFPVGVRAMAQICKNSQLPALNLRVPWTSVLKRFHSLHQFLPQKNSCVWNRKLQGESAKKNAAKPGPLQLTWIHLTQDPRVTSRVDKVKTSCSRWWNQHVLTLIVALIGSLYTCTHTLQSATALCDTCHISPKPKIMWCDHHPLGCQKVCQVSYGFPGTTLSPTAWGRPKRPK